MGTTSYINLPESLENSFTDTLVFNLIFSWHGVQAFVLIFIDWFLSYIVGWIVRKILLILFKYKIAENERRRYLLTITHETFAGRKSFAFSGLTLNRIVFYELVISWTVVLFGVYGILVAEKLYSVILATPIGAILLFLFYRPTLMDWLSSFAGRFILLYYDIVRVGELVLVREKYEGKEVWVEYIYSHSMILNSYIKRISEIEKPKKKIAQFKGDKRKIYEPYKLIPNSFLLNPERIIFYPGCEPLKSCSKIISSV